MEDEKRVQVQGLQEFALWRQETGGDIQRDELSLVYMGAEYSAIIENDRLWWTEHGRPYPDHRNGDWSLGLHLVRTPAGYVGEKFVGRTLLRRGKEHFERLDEALVSAMLTIIALHGTAPGEWVCVRRMSAERDPE